jgi:hypothetical protein
MSALENLFAGLGTLSGTEQPESSLQFGQPSPVLARSMETNELAQWLNIPEEAGGVTVEMKKEAGTDPVWTYTVGQQANDALMQTLQTAQQVRSSYMQEMAQLKAREDYTRQHGLFNLLSNLAGNFAQAKEMPGWVNALGKTSTDLNPTPDALMRQRMALQPGLMGALREETAAAAQMADLSAQQQAGVIAQGRSEILANKEQLKATADLEKVFTNDVKMGTFDKASALKQYLSRDVDEGYARAMVDSYAIKSKMYQEHQEALRSLKTGEEIAKENRAFTTFLREEDVRLKNQKELKEIASKSQLMDPLGTDAAKWANADGEQPPPTWNMAEAWAAGFKPVSSTTITEKQKQATITSALTLTAQVKELAPEIDKLGYLPKGSSWWQSAIANAKRGIFPENPKLRQFLMHASTMVSVARSLGDIGFRGMPAIMSIINIIEHPGTLEGLIGSVQQLEDAIYAAYPKSKEWAAEGAKQAQGAPAPVPSAGSNVEQIVMGPDKKKHRMVLENGAWVDKGVI